jgi:hypothetical protein
MILGKGGTILGVIGLILGAGALGLGGYAWLSVLNVETQVANFSEQSTWYRYNETFLVCTPPATFIPFTGLMINFELGSNEYVHFSFTTRAHVEPVAGWSRIVIYFLVDGVAETSPGAEVGILDGDFMVNFMIHLQCVRDDLLPGDHSVTVLIWGDSTANYIYHSTLLVQKFPL